MKLRTIHVTSFFTLSTSLIAVNKMSHQQCFRTSLIAHTPPVIKMLTFTLMLVLVAPMISAIDQLPPKFTYQPQFIRTRSTSSRSSLTSNSESNRPSTHPTITATLISPDESPVSLSPAALSNWQTHSTTANLNPPQSNQTSTGSQRSTSVRTQDQSIWIDDDSVETSTAGTTTAMSRPALPDVATIHPLLIYSIRYEIKSYDLLASPFRLTSYNLMPGSLPYSDNASINFSSQQYQPNKHSRTLMAGLKNTIGLDFYYDETESYIFWTDVLEERINRGVFTNGTLSNVETIVSSRLATAEGLAVDWIGRNIYWVESTLDHIEVASMSGKSRRTLIAGSMESPRAISVDPRHGLLFWTDWDKRSPRIERATMSGEDRKTLVQIKNFKGGWPNGLTLDYDNLRVYWIDASSDSIHMVDYDGENHQSILKRTSSDNIRSLGHPFSVTLFGNNLYWTDWKTNSISTVNKRTGADAREIQRLDTRLFDIKVFHPSRQPRIDEKLNPCSKNNGDCSHLCLLTVNHTRKCECPHLMRIGPDGKTCMVHEHVLVIGRTNEIRAVDPDEPLHHVMAPVSVPKVYSPRQFQFDAKSKSIFWADSQSSEVKRTQLTGGGIDTIIDTIIESPGGLALDWIAGNLYVSSAAHQKSLGKIFISNLNGEYIAVLMDSSHGLVSPKSLAVHPLLGLLFCVDEEDVSSPIIFVANMDGSHKRTIATQLTSKLAHPTSLSVDFVSNRLYWINSGTIKNSEHAVIQFYDITSGNVVTLLEESNSDMTTRPTALCVDGDYLMINRASYDSIIKISKGNASEFTTLQTQSLDQLSALMVYNSSVQTGTNACGINNGNCSQLCVPTGAVDRICKCTMGFQIHPSNETACLGKELFLIYSYNLGMRGISLDQSSAIDEYYLPPIHRAFRASSIDYVYRQNLIYWVDNEEGSITRINRDTTNYQVIVQGLESEESIAVDWVAGNIYWIDPYYDVIEVSRLNGSQRYVIVSGDMDKANGIIVNPLKGYLVWSDVFGSQPKIETAALDGSNRRIVVSKNISHIDDITIDYADDFIYWIDSGLATIERIKPDGSERSVVYSTASNQGSHLVSLAVYRDHLFVADSDLQGSIIRMNKSNSAELQVIHSQLGDGIRDITIFAEQPIPTPEENPCVSFNGGCQDLCLFMGDRGKRRCICSHGKLRADGMTCQPYDTFLLFSKLTQIDSLHIRDDEPSNNSPFPPIPVENRGSIIALTVDHSAQRVIYSDMTRHQIASVYFNGTDRRLLVDKQSHVEGIAYANDQLYWASIEPNSISRLNISSSGVVKRNASVEKIIRLGQDDKPRGIAVDVCTSYVYWTNWNSEASIQRASPHNKYKVESIIKTDIKVPNGITIDQKMRRLYWCDAKLDKIEACNMDGSDRIVLMHSSPQHPFALAIWDNYVFWTDWLARGVYRADKFTGYQPTKIKKIVERPMGIAVAAPDDYNCQADHCSVNNGNCPSGYTCVTRVEVPNIKTYECRRRSHELVTPPHRCKHGNRGPDCEPTNYHDIIMDSFDRYNFTNPDSKDGFKQDFENSGSQEEFVNPNSSMSSVQEISRRLPSSSPTVTPTPRSSVSGIMTTTIVPTPKKVSTESYNLSSTTGKTLSGSTSNDVRTGETISWPPIITETPPARNRSVSTATSLTPKTLDSVGNLSVGSTLVPPSSVPPRTVFFPEHEPTSRTPPRTEFVPINPPPTKFLPEHKPATVANKPVTPPSVKPTVDEESSAMSSTQAPNTTLSPCQIVPAALAPTSGTTADSTVNGDHCKTPGEFKCYLSEKLVCISIEQRCNGEADCPNKEDENDCLLSRRSSSYILKFENNWHRYVTVIMIILGAALAAMFLVFGNRTRRRWFVNTNGAFNHRRMFDSDNGNNIEISNPMFDEDDPGNMAQCAFSIDLNECTTNFSNPLYERQVLLMNDGKGDKQ